MTKKLDLHIAGGGRTDGAPRPSGISSPRHSGIGPHGWEGECGLLLKAV